jgi:hypothetical protein
MDLTVLCCIAFKMYCKSFSFNLSYAKSRLVNIWIHILSFYDLQWAIYTWYRWYVSVIAFSRIQTFLIERRIVNSSRLSSIRYTSSTGNWRRFDIFSFSFYTYVSIDVISLKLPRGLTKDCFDKQLKKKKTHRTNFL